MTTDSESTGPKQPAAARKTAAKKKTATKKAAVKKVATKKAAAKKVAPVKAAAGESVLTATRAALEQEAAVVHAADEMQKRYQEKQQRLSQPAPPASATDPEAQGSPDAVISVREPEISYPAAAHIETAPVPPPSASAPAATTAVKPEQAGPAGPASDVPRQINPEPDTPVQPVQAEASDQAGAMPAAAAAEPAPAQDAANTPSWQSRDSRSDSSSEQSQGRFKGRKSWKERKRERFLQKQQAAAEGGAEDETEQNHTSAPLEPCAGMTEIAPKGFGFLRTADKNYVAGRLDVFVPPEFVRKYTLRDGMYLEGECRRSRRGPQMITLTKINGVDPEKYADRPLFEELKAVNPDRRYLLETDKGRFTTRVIDMLAPIGRGQRGLIVAPPRTGKTTILEHIAQALDHNHPDVHVIVLLVDERPEEVTQMKRVLENAEIFSSSNDSNVKNHVRIAELAIERAKRLVEAGEHVVVLLDSITRLGRAYNNAMKGGGRTMSGGIDIRALELPRRLFAAARNTREGGSLTIIATALVETGSKMDELIFQEFKGTGNMELVLDRKIAQQYVYPAVDIFRSGTRREELLLPEKHLDKIYRVRRGLSGHRPSEAIERLLQIMGKFSSNAQMLLEIPAA